MNAPASLTKIEQIRARDGDGCWLCARAFNFAAAPNSKNAPTLEHLVAKSLGGGNELANLVLCHKHCNLQLADKPLAKKQEMRAKYQANAAKVAAAVSAAKATPPVAKAPATVAAAPPTPARPAPPPPVAPAPVVAQLRAELAYWRRLALVGGGAGLASLGFIAGLGAGLLLG